MSPRWCAGGAPAWCDRLHQLYTAAGRLVDCATCHAQSAMAPLHIAVSDLKFTTPSETSGLCLKCHADSQVPVAMATTHDHVPRSPDSPFDVRTGQSTSSSPA